MIPYLLLLDLFLFGPLAPRALAVDSTGWVEPVAAEIALAEVLADEDIDHAWYWSGTVAPTLVPRRALPPGGLSGDLDSGFEPRPTPGRVQIRVAAPADGSRRSGFVVAAPELAWTQVPEPLLPRWAVSDGSVLHLPRRSHERWRVRYFSSCCGTWWVTIEPGQSSVLLAPRPAETWRISVRGDDESRVERPAVQLAEAPLGPGGRRFLAQLANEEGELVVPGLPDLTRISLLATARGHVPRAVAGLPSSLPETIVLAPGVEVVGRFVDLEGRPVAGVHVQLEMPLAGGFWSIVRTSGADGHFVFAGASPGAASALARARGFGQRRLEAEVGPEGLDLGDLVLEPEATSTVLVTDPQGRPVAAAEVIARPGVGGVTDEAGRVRLGGLSASAVLDLEVDAVGFRAATARFEPPVEALLEVELEPSFVVVGRHVDADGRPIGNARATARAGTRIVQRRLGEEGELLLELEPGREAELRIASPTSRELRLSIEAGAPGEWRDLGDLAAPRDHPVRGRLRSATNGEPVPGARVWVPRPSARHPAEAWMRGDLVTARSDAHGRFVLSGVPPVAAELRVEADGFARRQVSVPPTADSRETELGEIYLRPGVEVELRVEGALRGRAAAGDRVARLDLGNRFLEMDMLSAPIVDGLARFSQVPPGAATAVVYSGRELLCEKRVEVPADVDWFEVVCQSTPMRVAGRVELGGRRSGAGHLLWLPPPPDGPGWIEHTRSDLGQTRSAVFGGGRPQVEVAVGADGFFESEKLRPGAWEVIWRPDSGGASPTREVILPEADEAVVVIEYPLRTVSGRVVDGEENGIEGARVRELGSGLLAFGDERGEFELVGLEPGSIWLRAESAGLRSAAIEVRVEESFDPPPVRLVLGREDERDQLVVRVIGDAGPVTGAFVFSETLPPTGQRISTTDAEGRIWLELEPPFPDQVRFAVLGEEAEATGGSRTSEAWAFVPWRELGAERAGREEGPREIVLAPALGGQLTVRFAQPVDELRMSSPDGWDLAWLLRRSGRLAQVGPERPWVVGGLPAGTYELTVDGESRSVGVVAGQATVVDWPDPGP